MSKVTHLPPFSKTLHVEADIPVSQRDEFERAIVDIIASERPRMDALHRDLEAITRRAMAAPQTIERRSMIIRPPVRQRAWYASSPASTAGGPQETDFLAR
jgi:hypothetical protein